jgi:hypothetical protein
MFTVSNTRKQARRNLLGPVLIFPVVLFLLGWLILNGLILPAFGLEEGPVRLWTAAAIMLVVDAGIIWLWLWVQRIAVAQSKLIVSPEGLTLNDGVTNRTLPWASMTKVGIVKPFRGLEGSSRASSANIGMMVGTAVNRTAQALSGSVGLLGRGTIAPDPTNPASRKLLEINRGIWGTDDAGNPLVGIAPDQVVEGWIDGRVGDWLRHYRPDLAEEAARQLQR